MSIFYSKDDGRPKIHVHVENTYVHAEGVSCKSTLLHTGCTNHSNAYWAPLSTTVGLSFVCKSSNHKICIKFHSWNNSRSDFVQEQKPTVAQRWHGEIFKIPLLLRGHAIALRAHAVAILRAHAITFTWPRNSLT